MTDRARLLAALDGLDPTGSVSVGWLVRLLRQFGGDPTVELTFDGTTASLPQKAMTLRAVALRCGRSPGTVGAWQRTWRRLGLVRAGPPTAVNVALLREACSGARTAGPELERVPAAVEPARSPHCADGEKLDILLRHPAPRSGRWRRGARRRDHRSGAAPRGTDRAISRAVVRRPVSSKRVREFFRFFLTAFFWGARRAERRAFYRAA